MKSIFSNDTIFAKIMNKVGDIILLSVLWVVCSLPVITIGAATCAAYYVTIKVIRHNSGYLCKNFFKSFRLNFKQSIPLTLAFVFLSGLLVFNYLSINSELAEIAFYLRIIFIAIGAAIVGIFSYAFALLSRFNLGNGKILLMSFQLNFRHFLTSLVEVIGFVATLLIVYLTWWGILIFPGAILFGTSFLMERVIRRYMPKAVEGSEEADIWYYQ